jgi:hypothetical protein
VAWITVVYMFFPIVFPNAFRTYTLPAFICLGVWHIFFKFKDIGQTPLVMYGLFASISIGYILVGVLAGAGDGLAWLIFVYVLAPFFWIAILSTCIRQIGPQSFVKALTFYAALSCLSVVAFFVAFERFDVTQLTWWIAEPNVLVTDGLPAATMHVFGSLIFFAGAFFAAPGVIVRKPFRAVAAAAIVVVTLLSGRTALLLAVIIGCCLNLACERVTHVVRWMLIAVALATTVALSWSAALWLTQGAPRQGEHTDISVLQILESNLDKISAAGGVEREEQALALWRGIQRSYGLGAGHGIGVEIIRSEETPWKYELLWVSTLFHVGVIGTLIYFLPFLLVAVAYFQCLRLRQRNAMDNFMFGGLLAIMAASTTNPYLESFDFQWMPILPAIYFYLRIRKLFSHRFNLQRL